MLAFKNRYVREIAVLELNARMLLSIGDLQNLLADSSLIVRNSALHALLDTGDNTITPTRIREVLAEKDSTSFSKYLDVDVSKDSALVKAYSKRSNPQLREAMGWHESDGDLVYGEVMRRLGKAGLANVRRDLRDGFASVKQVGDAEMRRKYGEQADSILNSYRSLNSFIAEKFSAVALTLLLTHGSKRDILFARTELARTKSRLLKSGLRSALEIIKQYGNSTDVPALIQVAEQNYGEMQRRTLDTATSVGGLELALQLLKHDESEFVSAGLRWLWTAPERTDGCFLGTLLYHKDADIRRAAVAFLAHHRDRHRLESALEKYATSGKYFYNVVVWLDRVLYAPVVLREQYKEKLWNAVFIDSKWPR